MNQSRLQKTLSLVRQILSSQEQLHVRLKNAALKLSQELAVDSVTLSLMVGGGELYQRFSSSDDPSFNQLPLQIIDGNIECAGEALKLPLIIPDAERSRHGTIHTESAKLGFKSIIICGVANNARFVGTIEAYTKARFKRWTTEDVDIVSAVSELLALTIDTAVTVFPEARLSSLDEARTQYQRLARYGNIVVIFTDRNFSIVDVIGNSERVFGLSASELKRSPQVWDTLILSEDRARLMRRIKRSEVERAEVKEEVRIVHQQSGETRWIMLRALPQTTEGVFSGWEGFGIDTTDRRRAEDAYRIEGQRVEALLEVARALQGYDDPATVTLRGLKALVKATGCSCGYAAFSNTSSGTLEIVSSVGMPLKFLEDLNPVLSGPSLLNHAITTREAILSKNVQEDSRAQTKLAKRENLRSAIVVPLVNDDTAYGALALFFRGEGAFTQSDLELVKAAATQVTIAVKEAISRENEKGLVHSLKALYRISHELSKYRTPREMAESLLPVLHTEFELKRVWFGVLNDQGTHVVGQGAYGEGIKSEIGELQIEIGLRHDFFDEAIRERRPVAIDPEEHIECSGLESLISRLSLGKMIIFPLVSANQVVGVLIVEPRSAQRFMTPAVQDLVTSVANEIATVVVARRFESKLAEAVKMRMAGLLASGVAHNFNNILQAILGQVALIEMQVPSDSPALAATKEITLSTRRGGGLVAQLLSFATPAPTSKASVNVRELIEDSQELYESLLGRKIELNFDLSPDSPDVVADPQLIQQVVTNLLANAKDAVGSKNNPEITITTKRARVGLREVNPDLPPGLYLRIDVADNGSGMGAESLSRCFEPFFTTKDVDTGTGLGISGSGLGLSSAYSMIRQHEGTITAHSVPGEGSVFSIYLPVMAIRNPIERDVVKINTTNPDLNALCVGFERGVEPLIIDLLESVGISATTSYDISLAISDITRGPKEYGVLALDVDRFSTSDEAELQKLLSLHEIKAVLLFSNQVDDWRERMNAYENVQVMSKPPSLWSVTEALRQSDVIPRLAEVKRTGEGKNLSFE